MIQIAARYRLPRQFTMLVSMQCKILHTILTDHNYKEVDDTIRIMLATDNHIGYLERDPIRGQDSINTFKEILQLAVKYDVSGWNRS